MTNFINNLSSAEYFAFIFIVFLLVYCIGYIAIHYIIELVSWLNMTPNERFIKSYNDSIDKDRKDKWR